VLSKPTGAHITPAAQDAGHGATELSVGPAWFWSCFGSNPHLCNGTITLCHFIVVLCVLVLSLQGSQLIVAMSVRRNFGLKILYIVATVENLGLL
jgi:hypothetical protein